MTLQELEVQKQALEQQIAKAKAAGRAEAVARVRELMSTHGLTLADLGGREPPKARATKGAKVPAKYRDPDTGKAWSGRGLKPTWLKAALAAGKTIDTFAAQ
jgi:DNA-binding protein H-NS